MKSIGRDIKFEFYYQKSNTEKWISRIHLHISNQGLP